MPNSDQTKPDAPYCAACGYDLSGAVASATCPECGRPLVEVLRRRGDPMARVRRVRSESSVKLFGWPVYSIALGPDPSKGERVGRARGIIAIGDTAVGGLALGGAAVGVVAVGGLGVGVCTFGGMAIGALTCFGGGAVGGFAFGGAAVGGVATGGLAIGYIAQGGRAIGEYARGQLATGTHVISPSTGVNDPAAAQLFKDWQWVLGSGSPAAWMATAGLTAVIVFLIMAGLISGVALTRLRRSNGQDELRFGPRAGTERSGRA